MGARNASAPLNLFPPSFPSSSPSSSTSSSSLRSEDGPGGEERFLIGHQQQEHQADPRWSALSAEGHHEARLRTGEGPRVFVFAPFTCVLGRTMAIRHDRGLCIFVLWGAENKERQQKTGFEIDLKTVFIFSDFSSKVKMTDTLKVPHISKVLKVLIPVLIIQGCQMFFHYHPWTGECCKSV